MNTLLAALVRTSETIDRITNGESKPLIGRQAALDLHGSYYASLIYRLPSGSGIDNGTTVLMMNQGKAMFMMGFHHMDEHGCYDGWTQHIVTVRPTLTGYTYTCSGPNRNDIKDYLVETLQRVLEAELA